MAIQIRRGASKDFDESKMVQGELAVTLDTDEFYYKGGTVKKVQEALTFDTHPIEDSANPVTSSGIHSEFEKFDNALSQKVSTRQYKNGIESIQNQLTYKANRSDLIAEIASRMNADMAIRNAMVFFDAEGYLCFKDYLDE